MLTGDHPETARAIAVEVGILPTRMDLLREDVAQGLVMTAGEFDALTDGEVDSLAELPLVVARCAPTTKVRMIEALHRRGKFVAMTGDGVKDSPSLKRADVGIAMITLRVSPTRWRRGGGFLTTCRSSCCMCCRRMWRL